MVGVVDYEAPWQLDAWASRIAAGAGALRVVASVWPEALDGPDGPIARGLRSGDVVPGTGGLLTMGPLKVVTDGSLNTRTAYCHDPYPGLAGTAHPCGMLLVPPEELVPLLRRAAAHGIDAAVHAIGDRANELVLDAFAATGVAGRIEHAQLLRDVDPARFAALGVVASVQPAHVLDDRDVADRLWAGRTERAFAYRTLLDAGARIVLGSDAPVAPLDPWVTIAAAVHRSGDDRPSWHPEQEIPLPVALAASAGPDGPIAVGRRADLCVTDLDPSAVPAATLRALPGGRHAARRALDAPRRNLTRGRAGSQDSRTQDSRAGTQDSRWRGALRGRFGAARGRGVVAAGLLVRVRGAAVLRRQQPAQRRAGDPAECPARQPRPVEHRDLQRAHPQHPRRGRPVAAARRAGCGGRLQGLHRDAQRVGQRRAPPGRSRAGWS